MRSPADPVMRVKTLDRLAAEPWRYDFFHAMRLIECDDLLRPRLGTARRPVDEPVRLAQSPDQSFAPSAIHALVPASARSKPRLEVRFFGLFGPNGPLPHHLTEHARQRLLHHGDASFARFADMFHHRLLLLFYRAWAQAQPTVGLDRPGDDRFAAYVGSLVGIGSAEHRHRDAVDDHVKLHFAGILSSQVRNADGLASVLTGYLGRPVHVEQFVGSWLELPTEERTRLHAPGAGSGKAGGTLGAGAVLGARVWDRQHKFGVHVGPLDRAAFETLLPGGRALPALKALVEQYVGDELAWDLRLKLEAREVRACRPGLHGRLGWTSWLGMKDRVRHGELKLDPRPPPRLASQSGQQPMPA
jgi:type VI secretion system protein ImpH